MIELSVRQGIATFEVLGMHKLWALKKRLEIPLSHICAVRADPSMGRGPPTGWRWPGTYIPGLIVAGTYVRGGRRIFWDVVHPASCIVVDLTDEPYEQLVVEVAQPDAAVRLLGGTSAETPALRQGGHT